ncbi:ferritin-like domain-containing protein [Selenomonadales bacterium OttesenSCG-928-I06]|nr:ferritin-like domain-containing protein [Selenomonadales bacterium OttesenSCG-928-I06]
MSKTKGGNKMLTAKELMGIEDFLGSMQNNINTMNYFASNIQDSQAKQLLQQLAQKGQQHFQTIGKHLNAGQSLQ